MIKKGKMGRALVFYCIGVLSLVTVWAMVVKSCAPTDLSDILTFVGAAFGGELLFLLCKRVFAKPTGGDEDE